MKSTIDFFFLSKVSNVDSFIVCVVSVGLLDSVFVPVVSIVGVSVVSGATVVDIVESAKFSATDVVLDVDSSSTSLFIVVSIEIVDSIVVGGLVIGTDVVVFGSLDTVDNESVVVSLLVLII